MWHDLGTGNGRYVNRALGARIVSVFWFREAGVRVHGWVGIWMVLLISI